MHEYAVFWRDSAEPRELRAGGLAIEGDGLRLRGSDGRSRVVHTVPREELEALAAADDGEAIGEFPTVRLELHDGRSLLVACALGAAALAKLLGMLLPLLEG